MNVYFLREDMFSLNDIEHVTGFTWYTEVNCIIDTPSKGNQTTN